MLDILLKFVVPVVAVVSLAINFLQFSSNKKISKLEAERELAKREVELERLEAKHKNEVVDSDENFKNEFGEWPDILQRMKNDEILGRLYGEQRREWVEMLAEVTYFQKLLGKSSVHIFGQKNVWEKINASWRSLIKSRGGRSDER